MIFLYRYNKFSEYGYEFIESFIFGQVVLSSVYYNSNNQKVIVIDHQEIFSTEFPYKRYCQHQNELMRKYGKVYRFLENDEDINKFLKASLCEDNEYDLGRNFNREKFSIDPTLVEYEFEICFEETYGTEALKFVRREYSFITNEGKTAFIDYALFRKDGTWIAIEENGVSYHHPIIIGYDKYREILKKQNSVVEQAGLVYRWDTESLLNRGRVSDELKEFLGDLDNYIIQYSLTSKRNFALYEHQSDYLQELENGRQSGKQSALVVLPTGTGKTVVALEDIRNFAVDGKENRVLILAPTVDLVRQWKKEILEYSGVLGEVEVMTYAGISRKYYKDSPLNYTYIVVDEAHHSVAPVLRKVIAHYQPEFLLGLTATDKRLDTQKLESVFSEYEEKMDLRQAIEKGLLSQIRAFRLETNIDLSEVRFNGKDYYNAQLEKTIRVSSRNELIADLLYEYFYKKLPDKSGIVFCVSVAHAKEMAALLKNKGFKAESVDGTDKYRYEKIEAYMKKEIQFLCTCSLLNEGWDAPHTSVIVMARPTMSKVLYTQQLGRGTRNYPDKEALYVIDVVDTYGSFGTVSNRPWSVHSLFGIGIYRAFGDMFKRKSDSDNEFTILGTTHEKVIKLQPFDLFTLQKSYEDYLSIEQLARDLFVSTGTVNSWLRKGEISGDLVIPMGRSKIVYFHPNKVVEIRNLKGLKEHTEETIVKDLWEFLEQRTYTFSYKMYFILSLLDVIDSTGDADVQKLMERYRSYYLERFEQGLIIDRANCPYLKREYIMDDRTLIRSILENPFEKFERKRFMYYAKDLSKISIHHRIWEDLTNNKGVARLRKQMEEDLKNYYEQLEVI